MMEKTIKIFLEGNDIAFIKEYLNYLNINIPEENLIDCGGYTKIESQDVLNQFLDNSFDNGINLVIFDADFENNEGGLKKRKEYLEDLKKKHNLDFELFLFPNNKNDGDLEELLTQIATQKKIFDCLNDYENCLKNNGFQPKLRDIRKARIYSYGSIILKSNSENEKFKKSFTKTTYYLENQNYWNIKADEMEPLKEFLLNFFQPQP